MTIKRPLSIVHIIDELKIGGAQTHLLTMLRYSIANTNTHHTVLSLFGGGSIYEELRILGVNVIILDMRPMFASRRFDRAVSAIQVQIDILEPDIVEGHLTWSRLLGLLAAKLARVPQRIGFEHGDIYFNSPMFRMANYLSQLYTDRYFVCSDALRSWVRRTHHIADNKITVLHNCVDTARFHPNISPAVDLESLFHEWTTVFVMVGTLGRGVNKRVDVGIQALALARQSGADVALMIAGDGEQRADLQMLAAKLGVATSVHFLGMRHDIPAVMAAADALCHAAPFEPFGIIAVEAMAMGLHTIVPNTGGIPETVIHGKTGLIYPTLDVDALSEAMLLVVDNPSRRRMMGDAALEHVKTHFTVERYMKQLYNLYGITN